MPSPSSLPPPLPPGRSAASTESPGSPSLRAVRTRLAQAAAPRSRGHARGKGSNSMGSGGYASSTLSGQAPSTAPSAPSGTQVSVSSIFRKVELIGRGAYGAVYKGKHIPTGTPVALKVVNLDTPEDDAQDIQQEVSLLSQLKDATAHNVIKYWGCWMRGPEVWIVMDLAEGGSIRTLVGFFFPLFPQFATSRDSSITHPSPSFADPLLSVPPFVPSPYQQMKPGPIPERLSAIVVRESLVALAWLHRQGVIHRDIKAANLLLTNSGKIMLCDFGVAANLAWSGSNYRPAGAGDAHDHKDHKHARGNYATALGALTRAADKAGHKDVQFHNQKEPTRDTSAQDAGWKRTTMIGTPYWMAPEVIVRGALYDQSADVWSLGITIWEMLLGNPPLAAIDQARVIQLIPKNTPPRLGVDSGFSAECRELVQACLNEVPRERPTAEELTKFKWIKSTGKLPTTVLTELLTRYNNWVKQGGLRVSLIGGLATNGAEMERKSSKASTTPHSRDSFVYDGVESDFGWEFSSAASSTGSGSDSDNDLRTDRGQFNMDDPLDLGHPPRTQQSHSTPGQTSNMLAMPPPPPRANSLMDLFADENDPATAEMPLMPPPPISALAGGSSITLPELDMNDATGMNGMGGTLRPPPTIAPSIEPRSAPTTPVLGGASTPSITTPESAATLTPAPRPPPPITRAQTAPMVADTKPHVAGFSGTGSTPFRFGGGGGAVATQLPPNHSKPAAQALEAPISVRPGSRAQTLSPECMIIPASKDEVRSTSSPHPSEAGSQSTPSAGGIQDRPLTAVTPPTPAAHRLMAMTNPYNVGGSGVLHRRRQSSLSSRGHSASASVDDAGTSKFTRPARSASRPPPPGSHMNHLPASQGPGTPATTATSALESSGGESGSGTSTTPTTTHQRRSRTESAPDPPASLGRVGDARPPPPLPVARGSVHTRGTHGGSDPTSGAGSALLPHAARARSRSREVRTDVNPTGWVAGPPVVPPPVPALDLAALKTKEEVSTALGARVEELARWLELLTGSVGRLLE